MGVLIVDAARTQGWTFARQNAQAAIGRADCGLAEGLECVVNGEEVPHDLAQQASNVLHGGGSVVVSPEYMLYFPCVSQPSIASGVARPPDMVVGDWWEDGIHQRVEDSILYRVIRSQEPVVRIAVAPTSGSNGALEAKSAERP